MEQNKISLTTAVLMIINIMVGTGILIGPGKMAAIAGSASFLGWAIVALLFLPLVLCTVQLSAMFPGPGGFYSYAKQGLGTTWGFFAGWLYIVGYTFAASVELLALRKTLLLSFDYWFIDNLLVFNVLSITSCILLNLLSLHLFSRILNTFTISKLLPLIILIGLLPFIIANSSFSVLAITKHDFAMLPISLPWAIFGFFGFEYCCSMSHLIVDSEKNGPRAILIGFLGTALLYMLFHFGLLSLMGADNLATYGAPAFAQFITLPIPYLAQLLMILIPAASAITLFAGANGMINANALLLHAMSQERLLKGSTFLNRLTELNRPWILILLQGLMVFIISNTIDIGIINGLCNMGILASFILPFISLFILQRRMGAYHKSWFTALAMLITIALVKYSIYCLAPTIYERVMYIIPLLIILLIGSVVYDRKRYSLEN